MWTLFSLFVSKVDLISLVQDWLQWYQPEKIIKEKNIHCQIFIIHFFFFINLGFGAEANVRIWWTGFMCSDTISQRCFPEECLKTASWIYLKLRKLSTYYIFVIFLLKSNIFSTQQNKNSILNFYLLEWICFPVNMTSKTIFVQWFWLTLSTLFLATCYFTFKCQTNKNNLLA